MLFNTVLILTLLACGCVAPPVDEHKKKDHKSEEPEGNELDSQAFDVEYKRYLEEVVSVLENDEQFRDRLMKANPDDIKSGKISKELEFVNHNVRSKLDELKRQELERLRQAAVRQYEHSNGIDKKHLKLPGHVDPKNPYTFESEDLRKLIVHTAKELEVADQRRKEEFKEYEMQKELEYQEQLKHMDEKNKLEAQKQHENLMKKHKQHDPLHHPGSKQQLEEVWEEQDHMSPEDFNPKTFFHLHDLDGNGALDANEVKALFKKELDKMYDPNLPEDDVRERYEEMERMREHVFNETDTNRDNLISFDEFMEQTRKQEFQKDEGWKGLDEEQPYSHDEYQQYANAHEEEVRRMYEQGLIPPAPPGYVPLVIPPGHQVPQGQHHQPVYHVQPGQHPNEIPHGAQGYHPQGQPQYQQYHPQQGQYQQPSGHPPPGGYQQQQHPPQYQQHPAEGYHQPGGQQQPGGHQQPGGYQQQPGGYQQQPGNHQPPGGYQQQPGSHQQPGGYQQQPGSHQQPGGYQQQPGSHQQPGGHPQAAGYHQPDGNLHQNSQPVPPNTNAHNQGQGSVPQHHDEHYQGNNPPHDSGVQHPPVQHVEVGSSTSGNVHHQEPVNGQAAHGNVDHSSNNNQAAHPAEPHPPQGANSQQQPSH